MMIGLMIAATAMFAAMSIALIATYVRLSKKISTAFEGMSSPLSNAVTTVGAKVDSFIQASNESTSKNESANQSIKDRVESIDISARKIKDELKDATVAVNSVRYTFDDNRQRIEEATLRLSSILNEVDDLKQKVEEDMQSLRVLHLDIFNKVRMSLSGIDANTRDLFVKLRTAVDNNDVESLAEVVRAADALVKNYDAANPVAINPNVNLWDHFQKVQPNDDWNKTPVVFSGMKDTAWLSKKSDEAYYK